MINAQRNIQLEIQIIDDALITERNQHMRDNLWQQKIILEQKEECLLYNCRLEKWKARLYLSLLHKSNNTNK